MNPFLRTRAARGATVTALAGLVAAFTIAAAPAASAAGTVIKVKYPVHGSTFQASRGSASSTAAPSAEPTRFRRSPTAA